jgi:hypothetical protein
MNSALEQPLTIRSAIWHHNLFYSCTLSWVESHFHTNSSSALPISHIFMMHCTICTLLCAMWNSQFALAFWRDRRGEWAKKSEGHRHEEYFFHFHSLPHKPNSRFWPKTGSHFKDEMTLYHLFESRVLGGGAIFEVLSVGWGVGRRYFGSGNWEWDLGIWFGLFGSVVLGGIRHINRKEGSRAVQWREWMDGYQTPYLFLYTQLKCKCW